MKKIAYRDTWGKGADSFIAMIYERLKLMHGLLAEDGSIYVHCDWRVSGYMRLILDEIFGKNNLVNEIIWCYFGPGSDRTKEYTKKHDTIFFLQKINQNIFLILIPFELHTVKKQKIIIKKAYKAQVFLLKK